jgi:elongation factor 1-alpha
MGVIRMRIPVKESKNIEFKERLISSIHLREDRRQQLAAQMRYKLESGQGTAIYVLGVEDTGLAKGLTDLEFEESLNVLRVVAAESGAEIANMEKFYEDGKLIGRVVVKSLGQPIKQHLLIGVCGHVSHGKSTLIATLMTGQPDQKGKAWLWLNVLPHEIERGLSADLHYALYGFADGRPLHFKNPLDKRERARIVANADKLISFVDTVGHDPWLRTTIRGVVGQALDYGILVVAADDGVTHTTREHLGLLLAMTIPVIICITKTDRVSEAKIRRVEGQVEEMLKHVGRIPYPVRDAEAISVVIDKLTTVVPMLRTSARSLAGYDLLNLLLSALPLRRREVDRPFLMFIDRVYKVAGAGTVVAGTIRQGRLKAGSELLLGPDGSGGFRRVRAKSIEMHYHRLAEADAGLVVGIALRRVKGEQVGRGMILCDPAIQPRAVWTFDTEVLVLYHPTRIATGYEPVYHDRTIAQSVKFELLDRKYLKAGETGRVRMSFKYSPQFIQVGDRFIFREGKTKGIGTVTQIVRYV